MERRPWLCTRGVSHETYAKVRRLGPLLPNLSRSDFLSSLAVIFRVSSTLYTGDSRFVLSGSDDGNVRVWKAHASDKLGIITARERAAIEYRESLKSRWKADAEVNKISRYVSSSLSLLYFPFHRSV